MWSMTLITVLPDAIIEHSIQLMIDSFVFLGLMHCYYFN